MSKTIKVIDPRKVKKSECPLVVLCDDRRSFIGFAIKAHSHGNYSHIMSEYLPGWVASQDFGGFRTKKIDPYLKPHIQLKFWKFNEWTKSLKIDWELSIEKELNEPWWRRKYDFLGILGQLIPGRWTRKLNSPWSRYCSERVGTRLRDILQMDIPSHSTPSEIDSILSLDDRWEVHGYWFV